jgi:poly-gamma-glutamate capsule biosynthesis protein CapA/YwtB (metallophosphatase superfamily)
MRIRRPAVLLALLAGGACARPTPPAAPAPTPAPTPPPAPAPADTAARAERARADSAARERERALARARADSADTTGVRVCAGGDVTLGTNLDTTWAPLAAKKLGRRVVALPDPDSLLAPLRPLVRDADVVLVNAEGAIGAGPAPRKCAPGSPSCFAFRMPVAAAAALRRVNPDAVVVANVANNHARDAGEDGWLVTARHLRAAGVAVTGLDTLATPVVTARGDTIAFLGFSTNAGPDLRDLEAVRRHVARAAAQYARLVVTMHQGAEGAGAQRTRDSTELFLDIDRGNPVAFAAAAVGAGADLLVGHGPHVVRAAEWRGGALVFYSLGNLLTYGPFTLHDPNDRGAIACAVVNRVGRVARAELRATRQQPPGRVAPDGERRALALIDSLSALDFPATGARVGPGGSLVRPTESAARAP